MALGKIMKLAYIVDNISIYLKKKIQKSYKRKLHKNTYTMIKKHL